MRNSLTNEPVILQITNLVQRGNPDSPTRVLKKRSHSLIRQSAADNLSGASSGAVLVVRRNVVLIQAVQPIKGSEPNAPIRGNAERLPRGYPTNLAS